MRYELCTAVCCVFVSGSFLAVWVLSALLFLILQIFIYIGPSTSNHVCPRTRPSTCCHCGIPSRPSTQHVCSQHGDVWYLSSLVSSCDYLSCLVLCCVVLSQLVLLSCRNFILYFVIPVHVVYVPMILSHV